jgi:hypothetical protein
MAPEMSGSWVPDAKVPVSKKRTSGLSRLDASAPAGRASPRSVNELPGREQGEP